MKEGKNMNYLVLATALIIGVAIGLFLGIFIGLGRMRKAIEKQSVGHLRIDRSEPDEPPRPFLELKGTTINDISQKKVILLKLINENYLSRN